MTAGPITEQARPSVPAAPIKKQRAPTLYAIIAIKWLKGLLLLALACLGYKLAGQDLSQAFDRLLYWAKLDPEQQYFSRMAAWLQTVSPADLRWVASGTFLYSVLCLVEGFGLLFRVNWIAWIVIAESAIFIPIEIAKLIQDFTLPLLSILVINILIVWYLLKNRSRLFKHHHQ